MSYAARLLCALSIASLLPAPLWAQQTGGRGERASPGQITRPPELIKSVEAAYPEAALKARIEGTAKLKLTISERGQVTEVQIIEDPGYGLGQAAAEAARQFLFRPAEIDGQPSPIILGFAINFELPILPAIFSGRVVDSETGRGIEGASITITYTGPGEFDQAPSATAVTEPDGSFRFEEVPAGPWAVKLSVDAYRDFATSIELEPGQEASSTYEVSARPINYRGRVREAGTRRPLAAIAVEVVRLPDGAEQEPGEPIRVFTDADGTFAFRGLTPGDYRVLLDADGFKAEIFTESIAANERLEGDYYIEADFYDEYTVVTTAERERRSVNRQTITLKESRRIAGTGGDIVRVVQNLPGVARAPFGAGLLVVRGSSPGDSKVFLEGDELPIVYHFLAGPAVINSEMIEAIDFYPGNFSSRFGRAIGGVINLETRSPRSDQVHGFTKIDLLDASALIEVPLGEDWSFALSGRRSYIDVVLGAVLPEEELGFSIAPYYYDYQSWLTYRGWDDHLFEAFIYGSRDELVVGLGEPVGNANAQITSLRTETEFHRGQLRWEWNPSEEVENIFMASFGLINTGFGAGPLDLSFDAWTSNIRNDLRITAAPWLTVRGGTDMQYTYFAYDIEIPALDAGDPGEFENPSPTGFDQTGGFIVSYPAFWAETEFKPVPAWQLTPGVRLDYYSNNTQTIASPRLTSRYDFGSGWAAKGGVGLFTQPPDPGNTFENVGNQDLVAEKAMQYAAGVEWRPKEWLEFDTTLFYRDSFDLVTPSDQFSVDEETGDRILEFFNNEGEGRAYGAEILLRHYPNNRFFGWIAYTLSRSERLDRDTGRYEPFDFDQTHIFTAIAGYNFGYNIDLSARFRYVTGNPFTPIVGSVYDADEREYQPIFGRQNSARIQAFNQLDLRVDKNWVYDTWRFGVYLDVQNVYNAENPEGRTYNFDFSESRNFRGLPIFPNLGVTSTF